MVFPLRKRYCLITALLLVSGPMNQTHAAHPLITEDTATQGAGRFQLEVAHDSARLKTDGSKMRQDVYRITLSAGLDDKLDVIVGLPYQRNRDSSGGPSAQTQTEGFSDLAIALKWRFYEEAQLSFALRPDFSLPTGENGLSANRVIPSIFGVMTYRMPHWTTHLHVGYTRNFYDSEPQRKHLHHLSAAAEYHINSSLRLVSDLSQQTNPKLGETAYVRSLLLGAIFSPTPDFDIDFGLRFGLTDSAPNTSWLFGLTFRW
ncbi:MAG: transporter [Burkholderiales bacterium]|nr:transporter [Burkholderiales bacterium]